MNRLGRYILLESLDSGGTSEVHAAVRAGDRRLVVLKQLRTELPQLSTARDRLRREAQLAALLVHPAIARLYDAGSDDGTLYLVMEHIAGVTFSHLARALLEQGHLVPYAVTLTAAAHVLEGLEHAHGLAHLDGTPLQVVHRDLSPRNLMLDAYGQARVIDFGVAHADLDDLQTLPGTVLGTPRYLSPEQARGEAVGPASDLYTLAVVIYELLTCQRLTPKGDRAEIVKSILRDTPTPAHVVNPRISVAISDVVQAGLSKRVEDRFATAADFRAALVNAAGDWARVPRERMAMFFRAQFPEVIARAQVLQTRAENEGQKAEPGGVSFALFEPSSAELDVPTRSDPAPPSPWVDETHIPTRTGITEADPDTVVTQSSADLPPLEGDPITLVTTVPAETSPEPTSPEPTKPSPSTRERDHRRRRAPAARPLAAPLPSVGRTRLALRFAGGLLIGALIVGAYLLGRSQVPEPVALVAPSQPDPAAAVQAVARPTPATPTLDPNGAVDPTGAAPPTGASGTSGPPGPTGPTGAVDPSGAAGRTRTLVPAGEPTGGSRPTGAVEPSGGSGPAGALEPTVASRPRRHPNPAAPEIGARTPDQRAARVASTSPPATPRPPPTAKPAPRESAAQSNLRSLKHDLQELSALPQDRGAFLRLHRRFERAAERLPPVARTRVSAHLSAAERSFDPRELALALAKLEAWRASHPSDP